MAADRDLDPHSDDDIYVDYKSYLVRASSTFSNVPCFRSSSIKVAVTSFSLSVDSAVEIGGVTPR